MLTRPRALALLIAAAALVYLAGNDRVHLWDRDEPRYAQTSRQILESGDWVVPRLYDQPRTAKPVLIYWCQAACMAALGETPFAARLPSVVAMTLTLVLVAVMVNKASDPFSSHAWWAIFILSSSALVVAWSARNALTDAVLLLFVTAAQACLYLIYLRRDATWAVVLVLSIAIALGGLTKGPVVLAIGGATLAALWTFGLIDRRSRALAARPIPSSWNKFHGSLKLAVSLAIMALIIGPWLWLIEHRSPGFLKTSLWRDVFRRSVQPLEQHKGPPGYYLLTIWGTFFPWSLFLPLAIVSAWRNRRVPLIRFCLAGVLGPWVFFEIVRTKLPHYLLPVFPPLAFLTADALIRCFRGELNDLVQPGFIAAAGIWSAAVLILGAAPWVAMRWFDPIPIAATVAWTTLATVYATIVFVLFLRRRPQLAAISMGVGMMLAMLLAFVWYLPQAWFLRLPIQVADVLVGDGATVPGQVQMIAYKEPSLAFYQGGTIREQSDNDFLLHHPPEQWPRWLVIRSDVWDRMPQKIKARWDILKTCRGLDYADRGRIAEVLVLRKRQEKQ
jgi:4-amino-4-deoxy-L-arabinose transferase-like glycosyltransferase